MTIEEIIKSKLKTNGVKTYPLSVPVDGTYPCAVYQRVSTVQLRSHSGNTAEKARMQLTCWAKTESGCKTLAGTVCGLLDLNRTDFLLATKENEDDVQEQELGLFSCVLEFFIWN